MLEGRKFLKIGIFLFSGLFLGAILLVAIFFFRYNNWYRGVFLKSKEEPSRIVCLSKLYDTEGLSKEQFDEEIEEKIKNFILSDSRTDFVVLTKEEVLHFLISDTESSEGTQVEDFCFLPSIGTWEVYIKYQVGGFSAPWVVLDIVKDNFETAQLYVNEIRVGDIKVPDFLGRRIKVDLNKGVSDAIIMLNENNLLGRRIDNIELLEDKVILKGTR
jgi:hypothetical protein